MFASESDIAELKTKYTILELDTLRFPDSDATQTAWCLISTDNITLQDLPELGRYQELHNNMMRNYKLKNWKYCEDAIEHLLGRWNGELDSFYNALTDRLTTLKKQEPGLEWDSTIIKYPQKT
jgi:hypothetical protein